jgi:hypothetical protein
MEPRTRRHRSNAASVAQTIRAMERLDRRGNGHRRLTPSPGQVDAFAVKNVVVSSPPIERAAPAQGDRPASAAAMEPSDTTLQQACERLAAWNDNIQALIGRIERVRYARMIARMRALLRAEVPRGAIIAVISRGDEQLVTVPGRNAWHFPQADSGVYAGHHPTDSDAAVAHLERLRAKGVRYLVIPRTAFWWLDYYRGLADHLQRSSLREVRDDRTCALFALAAPRRTK